MKLNTLSHEKAFHEIRSQVLPITLLLAALMSLLTACADEALVPEGYWRFDPPTQARILKNAVVKTEGDHVLVLTYFGGPLLSPGVNTEMTEKQLLGHMRCGHMVNSEEGLQVHLEMRYELGGPGEGAAINEIYSVDFDETGALRIEGLMNFPDIAYVNTTELTNEEALSFQRFSRSCEKQ